MKKLFDNALKILLLNVEKNRNPFAISKLKELIKFFVERNKIEEFKNIIFEKNKIKENTFSILNTLDKDSKTLLLHLLEEIVIKLDNKEFDNYSSINTDFSFTKIFIDINTYYLNNFNKILNLPNLEKKSLEEIYIEPQISKFIR